MSHVYEKQINSGVLVAVKKAYFGAMISMGFIKYLDVKKKKTAEIFVNQLLKEVIFFFQLHLM